MIERNMRMIPVPKGMPKMIGAIQWMSGPSVAAKPARPMTMAIPPQIHDGRRSSGVARPPRFFANLM